MRLFDKQVVRDSFGYQPMFLTKVGHPPCLKTEFRGNQKHALHKRKCFVKETYLMKVYEKISPQSLAAPKLARGAKNPQVTKEVGML